MKIFIVMGVGILIGRFLMTGRIKKMERTSCHAVHPPSYFFHGGYAWPERKLLSELSSLGLKSFLFFLIPTLVSIILVYILTKTLYGEKALRFRRRRQ